MAYDAIVRIMAQSAIISDSPMERRVSQIGSTRLEEYVRSRCSEWWAVLGSNQWPLPCETGVGGLRINDIGAEFLVATRTCYHVMSLDITQCHDRTVPKLSLWPLGDHPAVLPNIERCAVHASGLARVLRNAAQRASDTSDKALRPIPLGSRFWFHGLPSSNSGVSPELSYTRAANSR